MTPPARIDVLVKRTGSHYGAVIASAKRARQLASNRLADDKDAYQIFTPPMVDIESTNELTIAMTEIAEGKLLIKAPAKR